MTSSISGIAEGTSSSTLKEMKALMDSLNKAASETASTSGSSISNSPSSDSTTSSTSADGIFSQMDSSTSLSQVNQDPPAPPPPQDGSSSDGTSSDISTLMKTIGSSLESGSTSDAESVLTELQKDVSSQNGGESNDPFSKDLQKLSDALQSGSLSDAKQVFSDIQSKLASAPSDISATATAQTGNSSSQDSVVTALQALLKTLDDSSSSASPALTADSSVRLKNILTSALKSYTEISANNNSQSSDGSSLVSSTV